MRRGLQHHGRWHSRKWRISMHGVRRGLQRHERGRRERMCGVRVRHVQLGR